MSSDICLLTYVFCHMSSDILFGILSGIQGTLRHPGQDGTVGNRRRRTEKEDKQDKEVEEEMETQLT